MRIVCGSTAEIELAAFLRDYDELKRLWRIRGITDLGLGFFDNSESLSIPAIAMRLIFYTQCCPLPFQSLKPCQFPLPQPLDCSPTQWTSPILS